MAEGWCGGGGGDEPLACAARACGACRARLDWGEWRSACLPRLATSPPAWYVMHGCTSEPDAVAPPGLASQHRKTEPRPDRPWVGEWVADGRWAMLIEGTSSIKDKQHSLPSSPLPLPTTRHTSLPSPPLLCSFSRRLSGPLHTCSHISIVSHHLLSATPHFHCCCPLLSLVPPSLLLLVNLPPLPHNDSNQQPLIP